MTQRRTRKTIRFRSVRRAQAADVPKLLDHIVARRRDVDLPYYPARVVLQDLLGTPALVDLAALLTQWRSEAATRRR